MTDDSLSDTDDAPSLGLGISDLDDVPAATRGRAVALIAIAAVVALAVVFMMVRLRVRGTYDGMCNLVTATGRTC